MYCSIKIATEEMALSGEKKAGLGLQMDHDDYDTVTIILTHCQLSASGFEYCNYHPSGFIFSASMLSEAAAM